MRAMDSGTVDLIATDPPFNKSRDFHSTPNKLRAEGGGKFQDRWSWERDVHDEWIDQISDDNPKLMVSIENARYAHSDGMGAFMCFMAVRVLEMKRLLKPTGSIFLHCDPTASHYLKQMMDAIFGRKNFMNEIVWCYSGGGVPKTAFARKHDLILFYKKGKNNVFNTQYVPYSEASAKLVKSRGGTSIDGKVRDLERGATMPDWWVDINSLQTWTPERMYPTQKPLRLYERIIKASSNLGDMVLDPFCGGATTLVAAERLARQWVGIDIWQEAHDLVLKRLQEKLILESDAKPDTNPEDFFIEGEVHYTKKMPHRTDDGQIAAPYLKPRIRKVRPSSGPRMSKEKMKEELIREFGKVCQGCFREYKDERIFHLDHVNPRSNGGENDIWNRMLLCPPCNQIKGNKLTYQGLLDVNRKQGNLAISWKEAKERSKAVIARIPDLG